MHPLLALCLAAPVLAVLCWKDCRSRTLPNAWNVALALVALAVRFAGEGVGGMLDGALGGLVCGAFLLLPFLLRSAGGGDVKMLFGCGVLTGFRLCVAELLFVSLIGLAVAVFMMFSRRVSLARLRHGFRCIFDWRYDRKAGRAGLPSVSDERVRVPFGIAIAIGTAVTLAYAAYLRTSP